MIRLLLILVSAAIFGTVIAELADVEGGLQLTIGTYEINTNVPVAMLLLSLAALAAFLLVQLISLLIAAPRTLKSWVDGRRARRGFHALSRGLVAAAAGDTLEARRFARRGEQLLGDAPLGLLLSAQAALLDGNEEKQSGTFRAMLDNPDTEFLGLKGLHDQAMRRGNEADALKFAARALEVRPRTPWAAKALFELHCSRHEWEEALNNLRKQLRAKLVTMDVARRRRAVVLTASAFDAEKSGDAEGALSRALEAVSLAPALVPAAVLAARKLTQGGRTWKAQDVIETAWARAPHRDLAAAYARVHPSDDPATRARRMGNLAKLNPTHVETRLLVSEQAMALGLWYEARAALEPIIQSYPTARACVLMAEIAQQERQDLAAAQGWLARAARAPRDAQWRCARCSFVAEDWSAICNNCGAFDSLSWTNPHGTETAEMAQNSARPEPAPSSRVTKSPASPRGSDGALLPPPPDDPGAEPHDDEADEAYGTQADSLEGRLRRRSP